LRLYGVILILKQGEMHENQVAAIRYLEVDATLDVGKGKPQNPSSSWLIAEPIRQQYGTQV